MLGHGRENMDGQLIGMGIVNGNELDPRIHERHDERQISG
jgi:hypothetical protein